MKLTTRTRQGEQRSYHDNLDGQLWRLNWKNEGYPYCGIYVMCPDGSWPAKIGISQNPVKRLAQCQTHVWKRVDITEYRYCENAIAARAVEKKTHDMLREESKLLHGEWFDIRADKAIEAVEFAGMTLGIEVMKDIPDDRIRESLSKLASREETAAHWARFDADDEHYSRNGVVYSTEEDRLRWIEEGKLIQGPPKEW